ncbi:hypothetical protein BKE30_13280 [Alkanindiges hydrocarboniclasticus]|jgi:hypothetical protein|uniref:Uncharacterized protein n=1 Tax=Alkanindiges hydrocarboniclasticus TaxID=1907941 RepID=A0A1S8CRM3_9GAMM|nr:antitoxin VbhA family protein [Alkanindiges hydrocarboniclasticus]ONG38095.1 hypothetical protein BKE30_13280 [Alkanindiges hydrocarboniclasticus]
MFLLSERERQYREGKFFSFKGWFYFYDLTPSPEQLQAFERYVSGDIDGHEIQRIFHQLKGGKDEDFNPIPMDNWF